MERINTSVLEKLGDNLDELLQEAPEQRAELHSRVGDAIKRQLDSSISGSLNDEHGHIRQWQIIAVGSGGGYVAIRPIKDPPDGEEKEIGKNGPGAITNYLSRGHAVRKPSGRNKNYRTRATMLRVRGRDFYRDTAARTEQIATKEAKQWADELAAKITEGL